MEELTRRVVVTGVGLVCALGIGTEESWKNLLAGQSGIGLITQFDTNGFDCKIAGEIKNFDPFQWIEKKELKKMGRFIQVALAAADFAVKSSNWKQEDSDLDEVGVYVSSGIGGFDIIEREHWKLVQGGPGKISPFFIPSAIVNLASGHISIRYGARGPNSATATACSASAHAIGDSFKIIQRGDADVMISGGAEASITPMGVGGFSAMKALSTRNDEPARASRPFDADRDGFVVGEGSGILIFEALEHAEKRGVFERFENQDAGALADDEAVAIRVERAAGARRLVIARGQCFHGGKAADAHGCDGRLSAAGNHHVGVAALNDFEGVADGVRGSRAGRRRCRVWPACPIADGDVSGSQIHNR